jgi:hypothetical protein
MKKIIYTYKNVDMKNGRLHTKRYGHYRKWGKINSKHKNNNKLVAWAVGVTAGSWEVPGRKPVTRDNDDDDDNDINNTNIRVKLKLVIKQ